MSQVLRRLTDPRSHDHEAMTDTDVVFEREQAELAATAPPVTDELTGTVVADVELLDVNGAPVQLSSAVDRPAAIVLYRGAWCPFCNLTLRGYQQDLVPELAKRQMVLVAISPQRPDGSLTIRERNGLTFTVLSDPGNQIASALGVLTAPSAEAREAQLELGLDLEAVNADGTTAVPMPTVLIVDADRTIRWIDVRPDYSARTTSAEILAVLDRLAS
jgi:peroxiredoxin